MNLQGAYIQVYETCHLKSNTYVITLGIDTIDGSVTGVFATYS